MKKTIEIMVSAILEKEGAITLENLRSYLNNNSTNEEKELIAYAHMACFNYKYEEISYAIELFKETKNWNEIYNILQLCLNRKLFRLVLEIQEIARENNIENLLLEDSDKWFTEIGVYGFDMYMDKKEELFLMHPDDTILIKEFASNYPLFWNKVLGAKGILPERMELLSCISMGKQVSTPIQKSNCSKEEFERYCDANGIEIIRVMQEGIDDFNRSSWVYLTLDTDGIFKVYKELHNYNNSPCGFVANCESEVYKHLGNRDFIPKCSGEIIRIGGAEFIKMSYLYAQPLSEYMKQKDVFSKDEAAFIISKIAQKLIKLGDVLYLDFKPENILFDGKEIFFLDFGVSRILKEGENDVNTFLADPRYGTPECAIKGTASKKSLVYQLGILYYQLITNRFEYSPCSDPGYKHPFVINWKHAETGEEEHTLKFFWPSIVHSFENDTGIELIDDMLSKNPVDRPSLDEVANRTTSNLSDIAPVQIDMYREDTVLFIGRMGIPHKGHIEYIARLIQAGLHVHIAISNSYIINDKDPLPKWLTLKMIARSLIKRGFSSVDFSFSLTPYYEKGQELAMHFCMIPERDKLIGIASSNPDIHKLFSCERIFEQKSVLGIEGEEYEVRSWGEDLRNSVKQDDYESFKELAATGVTEILSFEEIKDMYATPEIEFVPGLVRAVLVSEGEELVRARVRKYSNPEEAIIKKLRETNDVVIMDKYSRQTSIVVNGEFKNILYRDVKFDGVDETIYFELI